MAASVDAATLSKAQELIIHTTTAVDAFADELDAAFAVGPTPSPGSTRAVAVSLAKLCRAFTRNWGEPPGITPARVAEFNRDVELLRAVLGQYAADTGR